MGCLISKTNANTDSSMSRSRYPNENTAKAGDGFFFDPETNVFKSHDSPTGDTSKV